MEFKLEALKILLLTLFFSWLLPGFLAGALSSLRKLIPSGDVVGTEFLPQQCSNKVISFYQCAGFRQTLARPQQISWYWPKVITSWEMVSGRLLIRLKLPLLSLECIKQLLRPKKWIIVISVLPSRWPQMSWGGWIDTGCSEVLAV